MNNSDVDAFLEHHGVKGMHWGFRNKKENKKEKPPLTRAEIIRRRQKRANIAITATRLAIIGAFVASAVISSKQGQTRVHNVKVNRPSTVKDIINEEREVKLSSLRRMHKEGKMDKTQAENFIKILNDRYDKKIVDAVKNGMK